MHKRILALAAAGLLCTSAAFPQTPPSEIGKWRIKDLNGRLTAMAMARHHEGDQLASLWLQCVPGGRLEYVPVALKLGEIRALWVDHAGDVFTVNLNKGRATGATAVALSKEFAAQEPKTNQDDWFIEMSLASPNGPMSEILMGGFSKMRAYMLANCKR